MDEASVDKHISAMLSADFVVMDTETTGLKVNDGRDYLMGIACAYRLGPLGIMSAYFPFRHEDGNLDRATIYKLKTVLDSKPVVFHGAKFDIPSLRTIGLDLNPDAKVFCTINMAHMADEELFSKELDYLAKRWFGLEKTDDVKKWADVFGWKSVPVGMMGPYARNDCEILLPVFEKLVQDLKDQELLQLWPTERRFLRLLADMEARGVRVNQAFAREKIAQGEEAMAKLEAELGWSPTSSTALAKFLLEDMGLPVLKRSAKTGKPSFDKATMEKYEELLEELAPGNKTVRMVLDYRGWQKAVSSLYRPAVELVSPDGRIRPNFKQHGTKTGRLSCEKPNLQQVPRASSKPWNGDSKRTFIAREGRELWGYDYSQLEFRLAVAYGGPSVEWLKEVFNDPDRDVFSELAARIGEERQTVKTFVYLTLYGGGLDRAALSLGKPKEQIESAYYAFKESISGIKDAAKTAQKRAKAVGYVRYWTGRRRHFRLEDGHHKAFNSVLQGGGAEVVKHAMIAIDDDPRLDKDRCAIVLQVHDEIVFEMDPSYREYAEPIIKYHMTNFPQFGVQFAVEGKNWTTGKKADGTDD